jgi:uncharacterized OB-fold protein
MKTPDPQVAPTEEVAGERARTRLGSIPCQGCGRAFTPQRPWQRHCSARCRAAASRRREIDRLTDLLERLRPDDPGRPE